MSASVSTAPDAPIAWLAQLRPSAAGRAIVHASSGGQFTRAVRRVGADAAQWAVELGHDVAERVAAEIPAHAADGGFDVLRMGTESTVLQLLIVLGGGDRAGESTTAVTAEALGGLPEFLRSRVELDELLRGIQLGHSVIAAAFLDECARHGAPEGRHEQMRDLSRRLFVFFDDFSIRMAAAYREEGVRRAQSDAAARLQLTHDLLRGHDAPVTAASRTLRYDLGREHLALIVWSSARTLEMDPEALDEAARTLVRDVGCEQKLVLRVGIGLVWVWLTPAGSLARTTAALRAASVPPAVHAVFAGPARGVAGFRSAHHDAAAAFELCSRSAAAPAVTDYRDVDLLSLLLADRDRAVRFARAELGPLGEADAAELRRTIVAYVDENGSPQAAAQRLRVSRNTVTNRLRRAEELLGRPLTERRQELLAAAAILAEVDDDAHPRNPAELSAQHNA